MRPIIRFVTATSLSINSTVATTCSVARLALPGDTTKPEQKQATAAASITLLSGVWVRWGRHRGLSKISCRNPPEVAIAALAFALATMSDSGVRDVFWATR